MWYISKFVTTVSDQGAYPSTKLENLFECEELPSVVEDTTVTWNVTSGFGDDRVAATEEKNYEDMEKYFPKLQNEYMCITFITYVAETVGYPDFYDPSISWEDFIKHSSMALSHIRKPSDAAISLHKMLHEI